MIDESRTLLVKSERAKRLLENKDYTDYISEFREIWAAKMFEIVSMSTTDPEVAQVQGELRTLSSVFNGTKNAIEDYSELLKLQNKNQQLSNEEDYNNG